jgi:hypothetical protein
MFHVLCGYLFSIVSNTIDSFDPFNIVGADRFSANPSAFPALACATQFGMALASEMGAMLRINCEAVMWKITTRGFTLEEVLIMAAMNLLASADTAKFEKRASQASSRRHQKETEHGIEVLDKANSNDSGHFGTPVRHWSRTGEPIRN